VSTTETDITALQGTVATHTTQISNHESRIVTVEEGIQTTGSGAASATGTKATAVGRSAVASGDNATAVGEGAKAGGTYALALGQGAQAAHANASAFGANAKTTRDNQQAFGTKDNTYTMAGVTSSASKTAQGAPTHIVTSNASGDLAAHSMAELGLASSADIAALNAGLGDVNARVDVLEGHTDKALEGVAIAIAMAGAPMLLPNEDFVVTGNWGNYEGRNGLAFGAAARVSNNLQLNAGIGYGTNENTVGTRAGFRVGW
jgi:trimeric autotransporter adhesin